MGYDFTIGNAIPVFPSADHDGFGWTVAEATHPDAPAIPHDAPWSIHGNRRSPSYTVWSDFATAVGLDDLFNGRHPPLIPSYPGVAPLTRAIADRFDAALVSYRARYPQAVPRFSASLLGDGNEIGEQDAHLARLIWLAWWTRWAVENCEHPAIEAT